MGYHFRAGKRQLKVNENRKEDNETYLNTNISDDHEYQVLIFPEQVRVICLINFRIAEPGVLVLRYNYRIDHRLFI